MQKIEDPQNIGSFTETEKSLLREQEKPSEDIGSLTPPLLELAYGKKLYHLAVPKELGGAELSVPSFMEIFESASYLNGSFGWNLTLGAGAGVFGAYMNPDFAEEVFSGSKAFITGSGYPAGRAQPADDDPNSFVASGRWKYASGSPYATLFTASCLLPGSTPDNPKMIALAFYPDEVNKLQTWNSYGLTATGSHDFEVDNVGVPRCRSFIMEPQPEYADRPLYRFPFMQFAPATLASSMLGITRAFISEADPDGEHVPEEPVLKQRERLYGAVQTVWERCEHGEEIPEGEKQSVENASKKMAAVCRQVAFEVYQQSGMAVLDRSSRLNRTWRDLMTAGQHAMLRAQGAGFRVQGIDKRFTSSR